MLTEQALKEAMQAADKAAAACQSKWCRYGATIEDGHYACFHNGLGPSDTSEQIVVTNGALALSPSQFADRLTDWLTALHKHQGYDLNTGEATKK